MVGVWQLRTKIPLSMSRRLQGGFLVVVSYGHHGGQFLGEKCTCFHLFHNLLCSQMHQVTSDKYVREGVVALKFGHLHSIHVSFVVPKRVDRVGHFHM